MKQFTIEQLLSIFASLNEYTDILAGIGADPNLTDDQDPEAQFNQAIQNTIAVAKVIYTEANGAVPDSVVEFAQNFFDENDWEDLVD